MTFDPKAQLKRDADFARDLLLRYGEVRPMFAIHGDGPPTLIGAHWENTQEKRLMQKLIMLQAACDGADAIMFMAEAWERTVDPLPGESDADYKKRALSVAPADASDRIEIVLVTIIYRDHGKVVADGVTMEIVRDAAGKVTGTKPLHQDEKGAYEGRVIEMLTPRKLTSGERRVAQAALDTLKELVGFHSMVDGKHVHPKAGHA